MELLEIVRNLFIAVITSWLTVQWSLRRFRQEKWWEKKVQVYEKIISALYKAKRFNSVQKEMELDRRYSNEYLKKVNELYGDYYLNLQEARDTGLLLISGNAHQLLVKYLEDTDLDPKDHSWFEIHEYKESMADECLPKIIELAKQDLDIHDRQHYSSWFKNQSTLRKKT